MYLFVISAIILLGFLKHCLLPTTYIEFEWTAQTYFSPQNLFFSVSAFADGEVHLIVHILLIAEMLVLQSLLFQYWGSINRYKQNEAVEGALL